MNMASDISAVMSQVHLQKPSMAMPGKHDGEETCNVFVKSRSLESQFAKLTTCHGLHLVAQSPNRCSKLIWTTIVVGALIVLTIGIWGLFSEYFNYHTYMAITTKVWVSNCRSNAEM